MTAAEAREVRSFCRICAAACGVVVTVDGAQVVRVRGDAEHPVSRGYVCAKARGLPSWHHAPGRLDRPRLRGVDAGWDETLDDLAGVVRSTVTGPGPDAVGLYLATGLAYDAAGQMAAGSWLATIGSRSFYTAVTVDNAPVLTTADLVAGHPMLSPVWDPSAGGLLLLVGTNPVVSHGYGTTLPDPVRHLRDFRRRGGRIWVIDPRRTESAALADDHVPIRPGADVVLLAALVSDALDMLTTTGEPRRVVDGCDPRDLDALADALAPFTLERAAAAADVPLADLERLRADIRAHAGRVAVLCGTGTTMAHDGVLVEWLRWVLLAVTGSLDSEGGMRFQDGAFGRLTPPRVEGASTAGTRGGPSAASRPDLPRVAGQLPAVALGDEIEAGHLRVLVVTGGNPLTAFPEPERLRAALARLDTLVVVDVTENELTDLATHVLPATGQLERADLTMASALSVRSAVQSTPRVVAAVGERRPVWWMLGELSARLGDGIVRHPLLGGATTEATTDEQLLGRLLAMAPLGAEAILAAGPHGLAVPIGTGWVRETMLGGGPWRIAPRELLDRLARHEGPRPRQGQLVVTPRREMAWSNSVRYAGGGGEPLARVHPDDLAAAGLGDGDHAIVTSAHGAATVTVSADAGVRAGVVSLTHGRAAGSPGSLTSARVDVDPLTTMPLASGVPVTISSAPSAGGG